MVRASRTLRCSVVEQDRNDAALQLIAAEGIGDSARCLDLGTGSLDLLRLLAELVGPAGAVHAFGPADPHDTLDGELPIVVRTDDPATADLGDSGYDLIHARNVLASVAMPDLVLDRAVRALRPGGLMVISDLDYRDPVAVAAGTESTPAKLAITTCQHAYVELLAEQGLNRSWPSRLHAAMRRARLIDTSVTWWAQDCEGGTPHSIHLHNLTEIHFRALLSRVSADLLQRQRAALADPRTLIRQWPLVTAIGRRPPAPHRPDPAPR